MLNQPMKRTLCKLIAVVPWLTGCAMMAKAGSKATDNDQQRRFQNISLILVVDAVPSAQMEGVIVYDDQEATIYARSRVIKSNRGIMGLGGIRVPLTVRIIWRDNPKPVWGKQGGIDYEGKIIGDYTIPVAERIPDEVLSDIRDHGGGLRLKFRLKPDGVLFGWDIERDGGGISKFDMPGGDFLETRY